MTGGWRRPVAGALLVLLVGGYLAWRVAGFLAPGPAPEPCRQQLRVVAEDGTTWPASAWRCRRPAGPGPALLAWGRTPGATRAWIARLQDSWTWRGHETWSLDAEVPADPRTARWVVEAAREALADEWAVDPGRIGVILEGPAARSWPVPGVAAAVLVDPPGDLELPDPLPEDVLVLRTGVLGWRSWTGRTAREADAFLRGRFLPAETSP